MTRDGPRLIVVCGLGGTGKTTLAIALSRKLNLVCLHKDSIKAAVHDRLGLLTGDSVLVFRALVEEQLANGVDLIAEASFHTPEDVEILERWRSDHAVDLVCVVCRLEPAERRRRLVSRPRHASHAEADRQQLRALDAGAEPDHSSLPGRRISVTTDRPLDELVEAIVARLASDGTGRRSAHESPSGGPS